MTVNTSWVSPPSTPEPSCVAPSSLSPSSQPPSSLSRRLRRLLSKLYPQFRLPERRREVRYPFPYLVRLTPVGPDGRTPLGPTVVVVGKHISEHGLGFYHPTPLPYRRVLADISSDDGTLKITVLVDLTWCRFTREGWYDGGGRFLEDVHLPEDSREAP